MKGNSIDDFFMKMYQPINKFVPLFEDWLASLKQTHPLYNFLMALGTKINTTCYFKTKFKLNFTPCKMNPLYKYLMALRLWTDFIKDKEYLESLYSNNNT